MCRRPCRSGGGRPGGLSPAWAAVFSCGRVLVEFHQAPGKFIFEIGPGWGDLELARPVILLLVLVSLILAGAYFSLRRILKPRPFFFTGRGIN